MRIAHFGHSCVLVELNGAKILFDPGTFSHGFEGITGLDAIAITHQHPDHIDPNRIEALVDANPSARLLSDPQTAQQRGEPWQAVHAGNIVTIGDLQITGGGGKHAVIHPELPVVDNTVFQLGSADDPAQFVHPGDSLWVPPVSVGVLAVPAVAPWMKISEAVDYLRAVAPRTAVPIHYGIIAPEAQGIYFGRLSEMRPADTEFALIEPEDNKTF
ncbi:MBL fold metallo-hydrolase [Nocardia sp. 852002-20019_SCH5090214]|jgi:L-ascorbate metabolism protein UlaG (beta-lactamase superfamily)|uniref:MBL fold metallo-hydrolase n=2 Tax=Nocardia TaxID=1817 RepID=A0A2S6A4S5_9NOCA|nr:MULTISPECIES: MBL fold metallo-hydrolase [Nocardia]MBF6242528.1 MBL fold metallo-hydrolase [Nocardia elegans]MBF6449715.1 MBL fold metallo-hydrolase [Nocardia elegans]MBV7702295.1 MBL fold metallo-hydrolase [Nocardia nova]OBA66626.1 MBL fold metallo-hydrolase [Nocardia sp. 852002-20019_SCH5090214]PPJ11223.1 MBL fold metallo-hydrolase [Nocardia nova]